LARNRSTSDNSAANLGFETELWAADLLRGNIESAEYKHVIIGRKGAYRGVHYSLQPFYVIDTAFYVKPTVPLQLRWAYYEMRQLDINGMDNGSAIPSTSRADFYALPVAAPPLGLQTCFVEILTPCWDRQQVNDRESQTRSAILDTLLPKLISGELRVPEAKQHLEKVRA
jgi:type I restriction enzyme, S subunit